MNPILKFEARYNCFSAEMYVFSVPFLWVASGFVSLILKVGLPSTLGAIMQLSPCWADLLKGVR